LFEKVDDFGIGAPNDACAQYNDDGTVSKTLDRDNGADSTIGIKGNGADVSITFY